MTTTILFLCPHGAAKSVLAAAYLQQQATKLNLPLSAQFAGTDPSAQISPAVIDALRLDGMDWSARIPHLVTQAELDQANHIISLGCSPDEIGVLAPRLKTGAISPRRARTCARLPRPFVGMWTPGCCNGAPPSRASPHDDCRRWYQRRAVRPERIVPKALWTVFALWVPGLGWAGCPDCHDPAGTGGRRTVGNERAVQSGSGRLSTASRAGSP